MVVEYGVFDVLISMIYGFCWFCKVEFNQQSCWLYSVPNLFVF